MIRESFRLLSSQAEGDRKRAQAQLTKTKLDVARNEPLAKEGAISQKEFQDSEQANQAAGASVESAKAAVEQAKLNLEWTKVVAPINGVVGIAKAQIGDLVDANTALTSMSTLDPIRVYFPISEQEYLKLSGLMEQRYQDKRDSTKVREDARIEMVLSNGEVYPHKGWFFLADRQVDVKTGTIRIAALFPNPGKSMRPGQYAKIRVAVTVRQGALLVSQRAVSEQQGSYQVAVVTPENKVEIRTVTVGERIGSQWIIAQGLKPGEQVVVEGLQKLKARRFRPPPPVRNGTADRAGCACRATGSLSEGQLMARFFINRPIVAMVISILMTVIGIVAMVQLPIAQFPNIAPPEIQLQATYVGRRRRHARAVGRHADRAADERRRQHDLHVFDQRQQRADAAARGLRRDDRIRTTTRS